MRLLAIDPGTTQSAWMVMENGMPEMFGIDENWQLRLMLIDDSEDKRMCFTDLAIEMVASYGMPVGREVFETVLWTGKFIECANVPETLVYRKDVKLHLCGSPRAKDPNVWQAIVDRFGGKERAVGKKKTPGPLHGIHSHCRAALAVGLYWFDTQAAGVTNGK